MFLFGREVDIKDKACSLNGLSQENNDPYVNLYVRVTNHCQMSCPFCEFKNNKDDTKFDFYKFYYVLSEIVKKVPINKISFTGGEPTLDLLLNRYLECAKSICPNSFVTINSNGYNMDKIDFRYVDSLALSRHSVSDIQLRNELFLGNSVTNDFLAKFSKAKKSKVHISCNLIKGYVDSPETMYEFISHYSSLGFHDFGFVSLMDVNEYCTDRFVDFSSVNIESMPHTIKSRSYNFESSCRCANYLCYTDDGEVNQLYARYYCDRKKSQPCLVYDINCLKQGFTGDVIV